MTTITRIMFSVIILMTYFSLNAQFAPYTLSPKWYFGNETGLDFTASGTPVFLPNGKTNTFVDRIEGAHGICDPSKNIVFYSGGYTLYDANHNLIQNINGGTSSTQSGISIPDPADPANRFYLFTANVDNGSGGDRPPSNSDLGIHYYHIAKSGASITVLSGPTKLSDNWEVSEQLSSSTDGNGNYWIIAHQGGSYGGGMNQFWVWPVTSSGVGSKIISSVAGTTGNNPWQGSIKINKCQTRLASVYGGGGIEVYNWDQTTGRVTGLIRNTTVSPSAYGCEFSPDGNILYYTSLSGNKLYQLDITTGTVYTDPAWVSANNIPEMGTLQLGPDNKIYVTNVSDGGLPCYIGVINQPNLPGAACNYAPTGFLVNSGPSVLPNVGRGISNMAWLNPNTPNIIHNGCTSVTFNYDFKTYFNDDIDVVPNSEEWDFGLGAGFQSGFGANPTQTYPSDNIYNVSFRVRDQTCNKYWNSSIPLNTNCALPVSWLTIEAERIDEQVKISWTTSSVANTSHFIIEKSTDGINFTSIGTIELNKDLTTSFTFYDNYPSAQGNYYRIKEIPYNNETTTYSEIVFIEPLISIFYSLAANHYENEFTLTPLTNEVVQLHVYDLLGKKIVETNSSNTITFGSNFAMGTYVAEIIIANKTYYTKIVKTR